jgi:carbonic anhydrase
MDRIIQGVRRFQTSVYTAQRALFESLAAKQQTPQALFITCADSRVDPNLITQTEPGDLFLLRNAGNIIPPYGAANGGEGATIEYAVAVLGIKQIIVCGHSQCGAMKALLKPEAYQELPAVSRWFRYAEATRRLVTERYADLKGAEFDRAVIEENVLVQLNNLSTHPYVTARIARGELRLYGWYYDIGQGMISAYDSDTGVFAPLSESPRAALPLVIRHHAQACTGQAPHRNGQTSFLHTAG